MKTQSTKGISVTFILAIILALIVVITFFYWGIEPKDSGDEHFARKDSLVAAMEELEHEVMTTLRAAQYAKIRLKADLMRLRALMPEEIPEYQLEVPILYGMGGSGDSTLYP